MYTVRLYNSVDATRDYSNVRWFTSLSEQNSYFDGLDYTEYTDCRPIVGNNAFDINGLQDNLRTYSYMMFYYTNSSGSTSKRIYAFIDDISFVNMHTTRVKYTIDSFQTYQRNIKIGDMWVERENVTDDTAGNYTLDEGLNVGELIINARSSFPSVSSSSWYFIIESTYNPFSKEDLGGAVINGVPHGGQYIVCSSMREYESVSSSIIEVSSDAIISVFKAPQDLVPSSLLTEIHSDSYGVTYLMDFVNYGISEQKTVTKSTSLDGYTPTNKKLLTFPYCSIRLTNSAGGCIDLQPERFDGTPTFYMDSITANYTSVACTPYKYNGIGGRNTLYGLELSGFPTGAVQNDPYASWLNANSESYQTNLDNLSRTYELNTRQNGINSVIGAAEGAIGGALQGNYAGAVSSALNSLASGIMSSQSLSNDYQNNVNAMIAQAHDLQNKVHVGGNGAASDIYSCISSSANVFTIEKCTCVEEYARSIDDYFSRFGYKVNRFKTPNLTTHSNFNYVKCSGADITGNVPHKYMQDILNAFNNGVTLWHTNFNSSITGIELDEARKKNKELDIKTWANEEVYDLTDEDGNPIQEVDSIDEDYTGELTHQDNPVYYNNIVISKDNLKEEYIELCPQIDDMIP